MHKNYLKTFVALVLFGLITMSCNNDEPNPNIPNNGDTGHLIRGQIEIKVYPVSFYDELGVYRNNLVALAVKTTGRVSIDWGDGTIQEVDSRNPADPAFVMGCGFYFLYHNYQNQNRRTILITGEHLTGLELLTVNDKPFEFRLNNHPNLQDLRFGRYYSDIIPEMPDVIKITRAESLKRFSAGGINTRTLNLSGCPALESLRIWGSQLTSLDVSNNTKLENLGVWNNQLTSLDVSNNTNLEYLAVSNNQLTASALNALFESLPKRQRRTWNVDGWFWEYSGHIYIYGNPGADYSEISIAVGRGWRVFGFGGVVTTPNIYLIGEITRKENSFRATVRLTCTAGRLNGVKAFANLQNIVIPNNAITRISDQEWIVVVDIQLDMLNPFDNFLKVVAETNDGGSRAVGFEIGGGLGNAQNFTWQRVGGTPATGLAEFGLQWIANVGSSGNYMARIIVADAERLVQLPAHSWTFITRREELAWAINYETTEISDFRVPFVRTGNLNFNYVLGVRVNGEYIMIHITQSNFVHSDAGSIVTITGQYKIGSRLF